MDKAMEKCKNVKTEYDKCFEKWYSEKFLKGDVSESCRDEFEEYRDCIVEHMQGTIAEKQLKKYNLSNNNGNNPPSNSDSTKST